MTIVLDASVTLNFLLDDACTDARERLFDRVGEIGAIAPGLWRLEIANGLPVALRRGRIDAQFRAQALRDVRTPPIAIDPETMARAGSSISALAEANGLTV